MAGIYKYGRIKDEMKMNMMEGERCSGRRGGIGDNLFISSVPCDVGGNLRTEATTRATEYHTIIHLSVNRTTKRVRLV